MPQYMLLLHGDPTGWVKLSPEDMQKAIEKYMAWTKKPFTRDSKRLSGRTRPRDSIGRRQA